jgi:hypothetical protein
MRRTRSIQLGQAAARHERQEMFGGQRWVGLGRNFVRETSWSTVLNDTTTVTADRIEWNAQLITGPVSALIWSVSTCPFAQDLYLGHV